MRHIYITFIFLGIWHHAVSQEIGLKNYSIAGNIKNTLNLPVEYAQVLVQSPQGNIIAYTQSDSLGRYSIPYVTNLDSIVLMISRLGFSPKLTKLSVREKKYDTRLKRADESYLKEIVVNDRNPIEVEGDTISYLPSVFTDGTEANVEDVLEKLPGISVDKNSGKIKYQGKEIKKILLDGDDLTGSNYKVLSKNLSADWLGEVEILKRFTDSRLLHGIKESEDVAINLKLKEGAKSPLFGTVMLGGGTTSKYTSKAELLSYSKRLKLFAIGVANNTGADLETYDLETYSSSQLKYNGFLMADKILDNELLPPAFFGEENFTFHEGQFISNSMVIKPSRKLNIRLTTTLYNNRLNFNFKDSTFYFLPDGLNISLNQRQKQTQKPLELFQDIKFDYQLSKKEDLLARVQFKNSERQIISLIESNYGNYYQDELKEQVQFFGSLSYINKLNSNWVLITDFQFGLEQLNEKLEFVEIPITSITTEQNINQDYKNIGGFVKLQGKLNKTLYLNAISGWTKTTSEFSLKDFSINNYDFEHIFIELNVKKSLNLFKLNAKGRLGYANISYNLKKTNRFLIEPTIAISIKKKLFKFLDTEIKGLYDTEYAFLKPSYLFEEELFTSFRSKIKYSSNFDTPVRNDLFLFSFKVTDNEKSYLNSNIEWGYTTSDNSFITEILYENNTINNKYIQEGKTSTVFSIYSIDKYFQKLHTSIKFSYENQISFSWLSIEDDIGENKLRQHNFNIIAGTALTKKINISTAYKNFHYQNNWLGDQSYFSFDSYVIKLIYKPFKLFRFNINFQAVNFGSKYDGLSSILGLNLRYKTKNKKWTFESKLNNILNTSSVIISRIEPSFYSISNYPLQPRFLLLTAKYRF